MSNKLGKKICAGIGAFITVFGSNALSSAQGKSGQNVAEIGNNVNRSSGGGYSRNGSLLSTRTFFELLATCFFVGYKYKNGKTSQDGKDPVVELNEKVTSLNKVNDELKNKILELEKKAGIDAKKLKDCINFLGEYIVPLSSGLYKRDDEYCLGKWYEFDKERYDFVPFCIGKNYYSIIGYLNLRKMHGDGDPKWTLKKQFPEVGKEEWGLDFSEDDFKKISRSEYLLLGALDGAVVYENIHRGALRGDEVNGLWQANNGTDVVLGKNGNKIFSKVQRFNYGEGWVLCEGFVTRCHKQEGLVVRLTYGELVQK